jgi:cell division transport system permease protein
MTAPFILTAAERRLLPEGRAAGPMPWVIAIMVFLSVLAVAGGLALAAMAGGLRSQMAGRVTIQIVEADRTARDAQTRAAAAAAQRLGGVGRVSVIGEEQVQQLLSPWLGEGGIGLPLPALIDVDLADPAALPALERAIRAAAPSARTDAHARWLAPLKSLVETLGWLSLVLVLLVATATAAAVVLAARAALNTYRDTIDVLHLLGANDGQIARLFQHRAAVDALIGGALGFAAGLFAMLLLDARIGALESELVGFAAIGPSGWLALVAVPLAGTLLATIAARLTVERALRRML